VKLGQRMREAKAQQAEPTALTNQRAERADAAITDPLATYKQRVQEALYEKLGPDAFIADRRHRPDVQVRPPGRRTWAIAAAVTLLAALGGAFAFGVIPFGRSTGDASKAAASQEASALLSGADLTPVATTDTGELQIESVPEGARVMLDGREAGFTPLTLKDVPAGRHALVLEGDSGTVRRTVRVQAGERTVARYEITAGFLSVFSRIPLEIYDGNRKLGASDEGHVLLAPGQYKVRLVNSHYGFEGEAEFSIKPGEISTHTVTLPEGTLVITTEAGAEIFIEGESVGTAPLMPIKE